VQGIVREQVRVRRVEPFRRMMSGDRFARSCFMVIVVSVVSAPQGGRRVWSSGSKREAAASPSARIAQARVR